MTDRKIWELADKYKARLVAEGAVPEKCNENDLIELPRDTKKAKNQACFAAGYIHELIRRGDPALAQQYLGWVQGACWALGIYPIEEERQDGVES